jgi:3-oxoacyl-[acyl-carrier protein] reductase
LIESFEALQPNHPISIVCISSICGIEIVPGAPPAYAVAKSALNAYVRVKSKGLKSAGSRINAIAPGNILHENSNWLQKLNKDSTEVDNYLKKNVPLNRFASTSEIADLVLYLSSPKASFVSGSIWTIDGGQVNSL